jgi:ankyrin repeat protein
MKILNKYKTFRLNENLISATEIDDIDEIKALINQGYDVNYHKMEDGYTALMIAVSRGNVNIINYLIKNGANVNAKSKYGDTALIRASVWGRTIISKILLEAGANIDDQNSLDVTALIAAADYAQLNMIIFLIEKNANMELTNLIMKNFIDIIDYKNKYKFETPFKIICEWIETYDAQKLILSKNENMSKSLITNNIPIQPDIKKEYEYLFTGLDLNLL